MKERTLALAGIFQASELVRQAATHGTWSGYAASTSLRSLLTFEADSVERIYGERDRMRLGIETLLGVLGGDSQHGDTLRYVINLLQIERKFRRQGALQDRIGHELERIRDSGQDLEEHEREDYQAEQIAQLYSDSISAISPRIMVNGKPQYLKIDRTVNWVRTLLLAGLRSAVLWQQLGGGRLELMFGRKKIMHEAQSLLMG